MRALLGLFTSLSMYAAQSPEAADPKPLRLAIAGLEHGHVSGFLRALKNRKDVQLVGVFDADAALTRKYAQTYELDNAVLFTDLGKMLETTKPEAVATFTSTYDHPIVVEACANRKIHVMMEKPLAVSMEHAHRIEQAAKRSGIHVI